MRKFMAEKLFEVFLSVQVSPPRLPMPEAKSYAPLVDGYAGCPRGHR